MFWMMIVARGCAGFGAGGEYPVCATSATEAADETDKLRKRRGILVAATTDFAIDLVRMRGFKSLKALLTVIQGFVVAGVVAVIVLACYGQRSSEGVWRICFGLGFVVSCEISYPSRAYIN
jgi:MFS family permease